MGKKGLSVCLSLCDSMQWLLLAQGVRGPILRMDGWIDYNLKIIILF